MEFIKKIEWVDTEINIEITNKIEIIITIVTK